MLDGKQREQQAELRERLEGASSAVFFGGAGVSTESGIPDFRSADGIYHQSYRYRPEEVISHPFFMANTEAFYDFYRSKMLFLDAEPNAAHRKLAELERAGHLAGVVTQNIDGLHQKAGSVNVMELHGSVLRNHCMDCARSYPVEYIAHSEGIPRCESCGGIIKPDVVLYEESLDEDVIVRAIETISNADVLVVAGTSLVVYPAASFLGYFKGDYLAVVNLSQTSIDSKADLSINARVGEVFDW